MSWKRFCSLFAFAVVVAIAVQGDSTSLTIALKWENAKPDKHVAKHLSIGSNIGKALSLELKNSGTQTVAAGYKVSIGLYGQDPPILRYQLAEVSNTPAVPPGPNPVLDQNLGTVRIAPSIPRGTYNLCAAISTTQIDCFPVTLELTAPTPPPA